MPSRPFRERDLGRRFRCAELADKIAAWLRHGEFPDAEAPELAQVVGRLAVRRSECGNSTSTTSPRFHIGFGGIVAIVGGHGGRADPGGACRMDSHRTQKHYSCKVIAWTLFASAGIARQRPPGGPPSCHSICTNRFGTLLLYPTASDHSGPRDQVSCQKSSAAGISAYAQTWPVAEGYQARSRRRGTLPGTRVGHGCRRQVFPDPVIARIDDDHNSSVTRGIASCRGG
jgi:hypothetical protein